MATFSKYKLYELYETDDGINWFPMGEYKAVLSEMYSEDCGYSARTITETDYECSGTTKVITATTKYQESYDSGTTWVTTSSTSSVTYEENSLDCGYSARTIVEYDDECSGTTKIITTITKHQESYDSGITWITTASSSSVTYEENSPDCALPIDYSQEYFTTIARNNGTIVFSGNSTTQDVLSYSKNGDTWTASRVIRVNVKSGDVVRWRGTWGSQSQNTGKIGQFSGTSSFDVQGNIMSLIYGDNYTGKTSLSDKSNKFNSLFSRSNVVNAENLILPATTLASSAYTAMFYNCTSLTTAPQLPATTLASYCYSNMFSDCTSLTTAPELPATTLVWGCYGSMFYGCTSLTTAPQLQATTLANSCYSSMFKGCTSLTTAPELPATTLANSCYYEMFRGCTNLNYIKMLAININATNCLWFWVYGVANSGTFVKAASMTSLPSGFSGIPENWTVQNA